MALRCLVIFANSIFILKERYSCSADRPEIGFTVVPCCISQNYVMWPRTICYAPFDIQYIFRKFQIGCINLSASLKNEWQQTNAPNVFEQGWQVLEEIMKKGFIPVFF
jgi:hypothetical protein